jgi:hypothetical protein
MKRCLGGIQKGVVSTGLSINNKFLSSSFSIMAGTNARESKLVSKPFSIGNDAGESKSLPSELSDMTHISELAVPLETKKKRTIVIVDGENLLHRFGNEYARRKIFSRITKGADQCFVVTKRKCTKVFRLNFSCPGKFIIVEINQDRESTPDEKSTDDAFIAHLVHYLSVSNDVKVYSDDEFDRLEHQFEEGLVAEVSEVVVNKRRKDSRVSRNAAETKFAYTAKRMKFDPKAEVTTAMIEKVRNLRKKFHEKD